MVLTNTKPHKPIAWESFKNSNLNIRRDDVPSVAMQKKNHKDTNNWGKSDEAKEIRKEHTNLLNQGKFKQAWDEGIADVRNTNKKGGIPENITNQGILKAEKQWLKLDKNRQLNLGEDFKKELNQRQFKNKNSKIQNNLKTNNQSKFSNSNFNMSVNSLNFNQTIKGQLSEEISSDFQPSFQKTIDEYTNEYIFDQIKSAGRSEVHKYTSRISNSMDTYLSYNGQGSSDSSDWANEIFDENTCTFFRKVVDDWDNRRILPKLENRFNDSFEEFRVSVNNLLLESQNIFENSQARYFHRLDLFPNSTA